MMRVKCKYCDMMTTITDVMRFNSIYGTNFFCWSCDVYNNFSESELRDIKIQNILDEKD